MRCCDKPPGRVAEDRAATHATKAAFVTTFEMVSGCETLARLARARGLTLVSSCSDLADLVHAGEGYIGKAGE